MDISNKIFCGDSLEVLKTFDDESVDMVMTSPPYYGLRSYLSKDDLLKSKEIGSETTMGEHLRVLLEIIGEIKRVLKPEGSFFLNYGDCYGGVKIGNTEMIKNPRQVQQDSLKNLAGYEKSLVMLPERIALKMVDEQKWILRQRICWAKQIYDAKEKRTKGSAMPTSVKDRFNNTWEYLFHFVKNKRYYFNLDAVRISAQTFENRPDGFTRSRELGYDSKFLEDYSPQSKQSGQRENTQKLQVAEYRNSDGVIHWGKYGEAHPSKNPRWNPALRNYKEKTEEIKNYKQIDLNYGKKKLKGIDAKGLNRWMSGTPNYIHKQERKYDISQRQNELEKRGVEHGGERLRGFYDTYGGKNNPDGKNLPNVWLIGVEPSKELHFARFPSALCKIPIRSSCPPNGIVLDPFAGSGTVLYAVRQLGRRYCGIELSSEYIKLINDRLSQKNMFET